MTEPRLNHLERQFEPAVGAAVDTPRGVEMAQRVQPAILGAAVRLDYTGRDLGRLERTPDDVGESGRLAGQVGEGEIERARRTSELPLAQRVYQQRRQRFRSLPSKLLPSLISRIRGL